MKTIGIIIQIVGLLIMGVGIVLQVNKQEMYYLFVTIVGLFAVITGLFLILASQRKNNADKDISKNKK